MPFIDWIEDEQASGQIAEIYQNWKQANPHRERMPEILKCFSSNPLVLKSMLQLSYPLHFSDGHLTRQQKEMLATYVSALNQCPY
jgi:hypothetical protein